MPLYEYECTACHKHTEKIQKFSDPEISTCPYCSGLLKRVVSAPAFAMKGGGWYADGYASAKPAQSGSPSAETSVAPAAAESKPAAPATTTPTPATATAKP